MITNGEIDKYKNLIGIRFTIPHDKYLTGYNWENTYIFCDLSNNLGSIYSISKNTGFLNLCCDESIFHILWLIDNGYFELNKNDIRLQKIKKIMT